MLCICKMWRDLWSVIKQKHTCACWWARNLPLLVPCISGTTFCDQLWVLYSQRQFCVFWYSSYMLFCVFSCTFLHVCMHTHTNPTGITMLFCIQNQIVKRIGDMMQHFHITAIILLILVMKRCCYLKAAYSFPTNRLIPGHWTTICITNGLMSIRLEGTTQILMDCQAQLSQWQSTTHSKFCPE